MAIDKNRLRDAARDANSGAKKGLDINALRDAAQGGSTSTGSKKDGKSEEVVGFIVLGSIVAAIYWWKYVLVPTGALVLIVGLIFGLTKSELDSKQKWIAGIIGLLLISAVSLYLWQNKWPGSENQRSYSAPSDSRKFAAAGWRCIDINVREGSGIDSPGKGALSPKKFTQRCDGSVWVQTGSERNVVQTDGVVKRWVIIKTPNGQGWVNADLVSY
jgi:hypothetical protein